MYTIENSVFKIHHYLLKYSNGVFLYNSSRSDIAQD